MKNTQVTYELKTTHAIDFNEVASGWFTRTFASERDFHEYVEFGLPEMQRKHKLCELAYRHPGQGDEMTGHHNYR